MSKIINQPKPSTKDVNSSPADDADELELDNTDDNLEDDPSDTSDADDKSDEEETPSEKKKSEKPALYTAEQMTEIVKKRLESERKKTERKISDAEAEAKKKSLRDQDNYKELYEAEEKSLKDVRAELEELRIERLRDRAAMRHGLDEELADLIRGTDEDSIDDSAAKIASRLKPTKAPKTGGGEGPRTRKRDDEDDADEDWNDKTPRRQTNRQAEKDTGPRPSWEEPNSVAW